MAQGVVNALDDFKADRIPPPLPGLHCVVSQDWSSYLTASATTRGRGGGGGGGGGAAWAVISAGLTLFSLYTF